MREREREEEQALGELERDAAGACGADAVCRLGELEVVVGREEGGGSGDEGVDWPITLIIKVAKKNYIKK